MPPEEVRFEALGSTCHLLGVGIPRERLEEGATWVAEIHRRFSRFLSDSELSRLNARAGRQVEVSPELEAVLRAAVEAWWASGGLVNVCVLEAEVCAKTALLLGSDAAPAYLAANALGWWLD